MAQDTNKHLERARKALEKNKLRDAISEYQVALDELPTNQEAMQALADLYSRMNEPVRAAHYYGLQLDRLVEAGDSAKASALYGRFLRNIPQPPERMLKFGLLLQKHSRNAEAIDQYTGAAERFQEHAQYAEALTCYEKLVHLDPENPARYLVLATLAETVGQTDMAARGFLRAGQLTQALGGADQALEYFKHGYELAPQDRTGALLYAEARLRRGDAAGAVTLLDPFSPNETDTMFLGLYGDALLRTGQLDRARTALEAFYRQKQESFAKLFELSLAYLRGKQDDKAIAVLAQTKDWMRSLRRENEFAVQVERLNGYAPKSLALAEFVTRLYEEMNREAKYFDALVHLFDLYLDNDLVQKACDAIDKLLDVDPYDYRNQERIARLEGKADPAYLRSVHARTARAATVTSRADGFTGAGAGHNERQEPATEQARAQQALDDLIVQVEIFLQYSLQSKAVERLERIAELFPGEEDRNERLRAIYERANWWPKGAPPPSAPAAPVQPPPAATQAPPPPAPALESPTHRPGFSAETHRDLAAIAEITRLLYRQATPREVLSAAVQEVGKYLGVARCLAAVGPPGEAMQLTAQFGASGLPPLAAAGLGTALGLLTNAAPDALGGIELHGASVPALRALGLESAMGVNLTDKETQAPAGALLVADVGARHWQPNVSFFLQAVGDQLVLSANHTRLRSLVRSLAGADEKTGLLSRGSYIDCLLAETNRARVQSAPLSLLILHLDRGGEVLRQHGEAPLERYIEQLARTLGTSVRQTDVAIKYTAWSLAFILPDTALENARLLAEKLRQAAATIPTTWNGPGLTVSAVVAEASRRPGDDTEDRVTEWINRVESGLDEVRQQGDALLVMSTP